MKWHWGNIPKCMFLCITIMGSLYVQIHKLEAKSMCSRIVFSAYTDPEDAKSSHIFIVNPDGSGLRDLSQDITDEILPTWSADGKQILFAKATGETFTVRNLSMKIPGYSLFRMAANGTGLKAITPVALLIPSFYDGDRLSWSADGKTILFQSHQPTLTGSGEEIMFVIREPFQKPEQLTGENFTFWPTFLPDGRHFGYVWQNSLGPHEFSNLYVSDLDGKVRTRITDFKDKYAQYPAWSPDGKRIAFSLASQIDVLGDADPGDNDIYIMNADGTGLTALTNDRALNISPSWSPDGKQIAYTSHKDGLPHIVVMNANGSDKHIIVDHQVGELRPSWSPLLSC